ncbi:response regulator [Pseudarthrobacter sp. L19]|uniref:response regulator n=1 Tax=Pseudarthrobacter sp. L19 TaxID=3423951 RepID=UPI003D7B2351
MRAGARGFLSSETAAGDILAALQGLMAPAKDSESTVLILDQLPRELSPAIGAVLQAGLSVESVADSAQFWVQLATVGPDLVILGTSAAGDDAAELCRALRSDPTWAALPVIVLSDDPDPGAAAALFDAGADDVVAGTLDAPELAARVRNRIARARMLGAGPRNGQAHDVAVKAPAPGPDAGVSGAGAAPGADYDVDVVAVEDDPLLADLLRHAVTTRGYRFRHFGDGQAAADELAGAKPALRSRVVLLDVDLPVLNGFGLLRQLAVTGRLSETRVIMLTAHSSEKEIVNALTLGAFDHVAKPFSVPVLMQRVDRAMGL